MRSTITSKFQTTIPKGIREILKLSTKDSIEWIVEKGNVVVRPAKSPFLAHRNAVQIGSGSITSDIENARNKRIEKYQCKNTSSTRMR